MLGHSFRMLLRPDILLSVSFVATRSPIFFTVFFSSLASDSYLSVTLALSLPARSLSLSSSPLDNSRTLPFCSVTLLVSSRPFSHSSDLPDHYRILPFTRSLLHSSVQLAHSCTLFCFVTLTFFLPAQSFSHSRTLLMLITLAFSFSPPSPSPFSLSIPSLSHPSTHPAHPHTHLPIPLTLIFFPPVRSRSHAVDALRSLAPTPIGRLRVSAYPAGSVAHPDSDLAASG